jgi:hypothetical protein
MLTEPLQVVADLARVLDELEVPYVVAGSLASSMYGIPRSTQDVDLLMRIEPRHVDGFVEGLEDDFFLDRIMIEESVRRRKSFNIIHKETVYKADIFVAGDDAWSECELSRAVASEVELESGKASLNFASAEDTLLSKLAWYREGGEISERQWSDVLGILKVQGSDLDGEHLRKWAEYLKVLDLLDRALGTRE